MYSYRFQNYLLITKLNLLIVAHQTLLGLWLRLSNWTLKQEQEWNWTKRNRFAFFPGDRKNRFRKIDKILQTWNHTIHLEARWNKEVNAHHHDHEVLSKKTEMIKRMHFIPCLLLKLSHKYSCALQNNTWILYLFCRSTASLASLSSKHATFSCCIHIYLTI